MKILEVVTPLSIYHGCSTRKTFSEGNFTPVNMKICGCCNVSKHSGIKNGGQYIALDIYLKSGNLVKIKITSSEPRYYLGGSGKVFNTSMGLKDIRRPKII